MIIFTYCIRTISSKDSPPKWSPSINKHFVKFTLHKNCIIVTGAFGSILVFSMKLTDLSDSASADSDLKSDNLQYDMLVCWFAWTNDSVTKRLMFQALIFL